MFVVNNGRGVVAKKVEFIKGIDRKILELLYKGEMYPLQISRLLGINEQTIYYHIRKLKALGIVRPVRSEIIGGVKTTYYALTSDAFFDVIGEFKTLKKIPRKPPEVLKGIVENGKLTAKIIVGSPISHGELGTFSRDIEAVSDLGVFIGSFVYDSDPCTVMDTSIKNLRGNFVVVGGPLVNVVMKKINTRLPIRFEGRLKIFSSMTKKRYSGEEIGVVLNVQNPFYEGGRILVVAGCTHRGTRAAVISLIKHSYELSMKNVVRGLDVDSDGIVDDARVLE